MVAVVLGAPAFLTPARAAGVTVPSSIDATGGKDVTDALNAFFAKTPDRSTIEFPSESRYKIEGTLQLENRHDLTFVGHGAQLFATTEGVRNRAQWRLTGGAHLSFSDLSIKGPNANAGTGDKAANSLLEAQHGFTVQGVDGLTIERVQINDIWGDFVNLTDEHGTWSKNVVIRDNTFERNGRQGISITAAQDVVIEHNRIGEIRRSTIDIEPNSADGGGIRIRIADNDIGPGRLAFLASAGRAGKVSDVDIVGNRFHNRIMKIGVRPPVGSRRARFTVVDNIRVDNSPINISPINFTRVDDIVVRGNRQAFLPNSKRETAGVELEDSCNAVVEGNDWQGVTKPAVTRGACPTGGPMVRVGPSASVTAPTVAKSGKGNKGAGGSTSSTEVALASPAGGSAPSIWILAGVTALAALVLGALAMKRGRDRKRRRRRRRPSTAKPARRQPADPLE